MGALVIGGDLESDPCAGGSLLEDQRDAFPLEPLLLRAGVFGGLEVSRELEKKFNFRRCEVAKRQETPVL